MVNRYMKRCSTSLALREMQVKIAMRHHLTPVSVAIINKQVITSVGEVGEKKEPPAIRKEDILPCATWVGLESIM